MYKKKDSQINNFKILLYLQWRFINSDFKPTDFILCNKGRNKNVLRNTCKVMSLHYQYIGVITLKTWCSLIADPCWKVRLTVQLVNLKYYWRMDLQNITESPSESIFYNPDFIAIIGKQSHVTGLGTNF